MSPSGSVRLCVPHANIPAVLTNITGACAAKGINIENMMNKSRGENAYTMLDVNSEIDEEIITSIYALDGVRRVRVIKF
jgi:D-3-phosphoglycerate dehydrogenase